MLFASDAYLHDGIFFRSDQTLRNPHSFATCGHSFCE